MSPVVLRNILMFAAMVAVCGAAREIAIWVLAFFEIRGPQRLFVPLAVAALYGVVGYFAFAGVARLRAMLVFFSVIVFGGIAVIVYDPGKTYYPLLNSLPLAAIAAIITSAVGSTTVRTEWLPDRSDLRELARPWKVLSFAIGMAWLLYGALNYGIADWDVGISVLMGSFTYLLAPWSVRTILVALRYRARHWILRIGVALFVAWIVVDGIYVLYHTAMGNQMFRLENFYASSALYFLAGTIWLYRGSLRDLLSNIRTAVRNSV